MRESKKEKRRKFRLRFVLIIVIIILIATFFLTKAYLYINFLLGNDIIIKITLDKDNLVLIHGDSEEITFETTVNTNPFCSAECRSRFVDISLDKLVDVEEYSIRPLMPHVSKYEINSNWVGSGQRLYRFEVQCESSETFFCHTEQEPTRRNLLITVNHELSSIEKLRQSETKDYFDFFKNELEDITNYKRIIDWNMDILSKTNDLSIKQILSFDLEKQLYSINILLDEVVAIWNEQDYTLITTKKADLEKAKLDLIEINNAFTLMEQSIVSDVNLFNQNKKDYVDIEYKINKYNSELRWNDFYVIDLNNLITKYNYISEFLLHNVSIETKSMELESNKIIIDELISKLDSYESLFNMKKNLLKDQIRIFCHSYESACMSYGLYLPYSTVNDSKTLCDDINKSYTIYNNLVIDGLINTTEQNKYNFSLCKLSNKTVEKINENNLISNYSNLSYYDKLLSIPTIKLTHNLLTHRPSCPVNGHNYDCCIDELCKNSESNYPIILLHGHSVNKDISPEYSFDAFYKIEEFLEEHNYLSSDTISVYTPSSDEKDVWSLIPIPLTIKVSYYQDLFKQPDNYVIVQSKSESIDTYSIRLKELIDRVKDRTGRDRVIVIAHSMGGLVTRRYMQLFGEQDIHKLIMIGTPNYGVGGSVADLCSLTGADLECRDLKENSLFLNKLNRVQTNFNIPVHMIYGTGCNMKGIDGDGIVYSKNAIFDIAENHEIIGSCNGIKVLHTAMLDVTKYPEVGQIIEDVLEN